MRIVFNKWRRPDGDLLRKCFSRLLRQGLCWFNGQKLIPIGIILEMGVVFV